MPDLPYDYSALEPYIDTETMHLHHDKHHAIYVDNLNKALDGKADWQAKNVEEILKDIEKIDKEIKQTVINNAGGHANHSFFWEIMCPAKESGLPSGKFLDALVSTFGSLDSFKEEFTKKAMGVFGSGWAFLIMKPDGSLSLKRHSFQNSPLMNGNFPVLGIDVWEHAYYLKYKNVKADYIENWWNVVNWKEVEKKFNDVRKLVE